MVSGVARRGSTWDTHRKRYPARYWAAMAPAPTNATAAPQRRSHGDLGSARERTFASGLKPDLLNTALVTDDPELHDDIDQQVQQGFDLRPRSITAAAALFDAKRPLIKRAI